MECVHATVAMLLEVKFPGEQDTKTYLGQATLQSHNCIHFRGRQHDISTPSCNGIPNRLLVNSLSTPTQSAGGRRVHFRANGRAWKTSGGAARVEGTLVLDNNHDDYLEFQGALHPFENETVTSGRTTRGSIANSRTASSSSPFSGIFLLPRVLDFGSTSASGTESGTRSRSSTRPRIETGASSSPARFSSTAGSLEEFLAGITPSSSSVFGTPNSVVRTEPKSPNSEPKSSNEAITAESRSSSSGSPNEETPKSRYSNRSTTRRSPAGSSQYASKSSSPSLTANVQPKKLFKGGKKHKNTSLGKGSSDYSLKAVRLPLPVKKGPKKKKSPTKRSPEPTSRRSVRSSPRVRYSPPPVVSRESQTRHVRSPTRSTTETRSRSRPTEGNAVQRRSPVAAHQAKKRTQPRRSPIEDRSSRKRKSPRGKSRASPTSRHQKSPVIQKKQRRTSRSPRSSSDISERSSSLDENQFTSETSPRKKTVSRSGAFSRSTDAFRSPSRGVRALGSPASPIPTSAARSHTAKPTPVPRQRLQLGETSNNARGEATPARAIRKSSDGKKRRVAPALKPLFPNGRMRRKLRSSTLKRVGDTTGVYVAAVVEYLVAEVLDLAGLRTMAKKRKRIVPNDIKIALRQDEELHQLTWNTTVPMTKRF